MIYLAQTDTTAGFLSKDLTKINQIKRRRVDTPCLITLAKFSKLKDFARVPSKFKNRVRRAKKTTFIYPNLRSFRVVKECKHAEFLSTHEWFYSTSANLHGAKFDEKFARNVADVIVDETFFESAPSRILRLSRSNLKKIR
jgi:hypothetical protein